MEVHAHTHTERKKFKHYLWEFLMLFLAVFSGFLAENIREQSVERHREKQYLLSMLNDLEHDTTVFNQQINEVHFALKQLDTLIRLLGLPQRNAMEQKHMYYLGRMSSRLMEFYYLHDQTYEQMKSSGNLRLFHDQLTSEKVAYYYSIKNYLEIQNGILVNRQTALIESIKKVFDNTVFHKMQDMISTKTNEPEGKPQLYSRDKAQINDLVGSIHYYATVGAVNTNIVDSIRKNAKSLITYLKNKYHLK